MDGRTDKVGCGQRLRRALSWMAMFVALIWVVDKLGGGWWFLLVPGVPYALSLRGASDERLARVRRSGLRVGMAVLVYSLWQLPHGNLWGPLSLVAVFVWDAWQAPARRWIGMLWLWWLACLIGMLVLWGVTSYQGIELDLRHQADRLTLRVTSGCKRLEVHQLEALADDSEEDDLFEGVTFKRGTVDKPFLDTDFAHWVPLDKVSRLTSVRYYFTQPIEKSIGNENGYLVAVAPGGRAVGLSLSDTYHKWLVSQCTEAGWDGLVDVRRVSTAEKLSPGEPPEVHWHSDLVPTLQVGLHPARPGSEDSGLGLYFEDSRWDTQLDTFLDIFEDHPLDRVKMDLRGNQAILSGESVAFLSIGFFFMFIFAVTLLLAGRGVRRELEMAQARNSFTAMVSHELRTPVAALRLHTDMLEHHLISDPEEMENSYRAIGEQTRRLQHLIETVLDLAKIERGARVFKLEPGDVNTVVDDAIERLGPAVPKDLVLSLTEGLPPALLDREAATQVVVNLVTNAIRYARDISIVTRAERRWVVLEVQDRGPGIPRSLRRRIFDPYVRASNEGKGVGLGLALVRGYMEGHQGRISVHNRPGGGTIMRVQFRR